MKKVVKIKSTAVENVKTLIDHMSLSMPERLPVIRSIVTAAIAGEHVLMLGPPGTGKSMAADMFCEAMGGDYFDILMTRYTTPDEVFGPYSMKALENDKLERMTDGYALNAKVWFLDEIFKASSAILNTLLKALNERRVTIGNKTTDLDLRIVVAASNELPNAEDGLGALHDRFLVRHMVEPLEFDASASQVLFEDLPECLATISEAELDELKEKASKLQFTDDLKRSVLAIRDTLKNANIYVSDRRWRSAMKYLKAAAVIEEESEVGTPLLGFLGDCLWETPKQIPDVKLAIQEHLAQWIQLLDVCETGLQELEIRINDEFEGNSVDLTKIGLIGQELRNVKADIKAIDSGEAERRKKELLERAARLSEKTIKAFQDDRVEEKFDENDLPF